MIIVRADGNKEIGTGHLMRCISIMEESKNRDNILFLVSDEQGEKIVKGKGFASMVIHTNYKDMESELPFLFDLMKKIHAEIVVVDSYQVTKHYIKELSKLAPILLVEDFLTDIFSVDYILNYNIYAKHKYYKKLYSNVKECPSFLLGVKYAPLREQFKDVTYEIKTRVNKVLITTGGTDPQNLAGQILGKLIENNACGNIVFHVVCGIFNENINELENLEKKHKNIVIHQNVSNMAQLMIENDIAISAAGTTMYELAAVGLPTITYAFVDNQDQIAEEFSQKKMALFAGNSEMLASDRVDVIEKQFLILINDLECRKAMHRRMKQSVDGFGTKRIYEIISGETK